MFNIFKKKVKLIDTGDEQDLNRRAKLLNDAGIWTNTWETNPFPMLGGPHMKPADWNSENPGNKDDERIVYHLEVLAKDQYKAMKLLMEDGGVDLSE